MKTNNTGWFQVIVRARDLAPIGACDSTNEARVTVNVYRNQHAPIFINEPYDVNLGKPKTSV